MSTRRSLTVLGVTGSGKSTWIGALADGLYRGGVSRVSFDDGNWPEDTVGIDRARGYLQTGEFPIHTSEEQRVLLELPLRMRGGLHDGDAFALKMSDYDGELIEKLFRDRTRGWDDAWRRRARADAFLLLLRHDFTKGLRRLHRPAGAPSRKNPTSGADAMMAASPDELGTPPLPDFSLPETPAVPSDDPRYVSSTLALVELLQWIRRERGLAPIEATPVERPLRVGIVLTAWDAIDPRWKREPPEAFLATQHAILKDYLACNFRENEVRVFAVSATGGDLKDPAFREKYLTSAIPHSRVSWTDSRKKVVHENDLAIPLCWALYGETGIAH